MEKYSQGHSWKSKIENYLEVPINQMVNNVQQSGGRGKTSRHRTTSHFESRPRSQLYFRQLLLYHIHHPRMKNCKLWRVSVFYECERYNIKWKPINIEYFLKLWNDDTIVLAKAYACCIIKVVHTKLRASM